MQERGSKMSEEQSLAMIQGTLDGMHESGLLDNAVAIESSTVLMGTDSPLDSLAFVTFIGELEGRLNRETGKELSVVLSEVQKLNADPIHLSAGTMARFLVQLVAGN